MVNKPKLTLSAFKSQPKADPQAIERQAAEYTNRLRGMGYNVSVKAPLIVIRKGKKDVQE